MGNKWQVAVTLLFLQNVVFADKSERKLSPKAEGLTLEEFDKILHTDIVHELQVHDESMHDMMGNQHHDRKMVSSHDMWDAATKMEWENLDNDFGEDIPDLNDSNDVGDDDFLDIESNLDSTTSSSTETPFIICDPKPKSGNQAKVAIQNHFTKTFGREIKLKTLYNRKTLTCFITELTGEMAATVTSPLKLQPVFPEMKIAKGMVESITMRDPEASDGIRLPRIAATLCPGIGGTKEDSEQIGRSIVKPLQQLNPNHRRMKRATKDRILRRNLKVQPGNTMNNLTATVLNFHDSRARNFVWSRALNEGLDSDNHCHDLFNGIIISGNHAGDIMIVSFEEDILQPDLELTVPSCLLSLVAVLAADSKVCDLGIMPEIGINNVNAQWITQSNVPNQRPWFDSGLTGRGQVVGVSDTGIDLDNCYFWDSNGNFNADGSLNPSRRKVIQYTPFADGTDFTHNGHGTHVAGTIAGRKAVNGKTESDGKADGIAKDAKLAMFDLATPGQFLLPPDLTTMFDSGKSSGANIHSASWGAKSQNGYGILNRYFDEYSHGDDNFLAVVAAGNTGYSHRPRKYDVENTVYEPGSAKNVLTVGSSANVGYMRGHDYVSYFSSRGPTPDGRTKPDVIAPGQPIHSAASRSHIIGECDDNWGVTVKVGTSMATPVVSGSAALIRQYFEDGYYPTGIANQGHKMTPSGALVKAILINGAQALQGVDNYYHQTPSSEYDNHQNFGRISLAHSLALRGKNTIKSLVYDRKVIRDGATHKYAVRIDMNGYGQCTSNKLSATLVWMDPPAASQCTECLINDLDLSIKKRGQGVKHYPNGRMSKDDKNTVERIRVDVTNGDIFDLYVKGTDLESLSQKYALVISGCVQEIINEAPEPAPTPVRPNPPSCEDGKGKFLLAVYNRWRPCHWLNTRTPRLKNRLLDQNCKPGQSAWDICMKTCGRC